MLWYLLVPISVQITDHTRTPLSFREPPVSPASPLYTDGKRFPPLWATASLCSVIQVTNSNFLYFLHLFFFQHFGFLRFCQAQTATHQAGAQSMELENLEYPEACRTALGARLVGCTGDVTEKKGLPFRETHFMLMLPWGIDLIDSFVNLLKCLSTL